MKQRDVADVTAARDEVLAETDGKRVDEPETLPDEVSGL